MDYHAYFDNRAKEAGKRLAAVNKRLDQIAFIRLGVFAAGATLEVLSWSWGGPWWALVLVPFLAAFGALVKWNLRVQRERHFVETLIRINQEEPKRLEGIDPTGEGGSQYADKAHPYSGDLDLFGHKSLFSLLDRSSTVFGRDTLAQWLLKTADRKTVLERQAAVTELAERIDFRQDVQAEGRMPGIEPLQPARLKAWLQTPSPFIGKELLPKIVWVLTPAALGMVALAILGYIPWLVPSLALGAHVLINRLVWKSLRAAYQQTDRFANVLKSYANLIAGINAQEFSAPLNQQLQAQLKTEGRPAEAEIEQLAKVLQRLELHLNGLVYFFVNTVFFWDIHALVALEKWKQAHAGKADVWFKVIGEMEALAGMAALRHGHPEWVLPEIVEGGFQMHAEAAAHPLIPVAQCVSNPIHFAGPSQVMLVTGSNMSGKSTYLRTVGVNALLALLGAPVSAKLMKISEMEIAASMRTSDSLEENTSSFYAELKRLKQVIGTVETGRPTLFLLDEILKGTNSRDRHAGARALIRQLVAGGGSGLVSTHDIELQDLSEELAGKVRNHSFHCDVSQDGKLEFDYKLREGVCHSMNATALMRAMGIDLKD